MHNSNTSESSIEKIKSRMTVLDLWRSLFPQSAPKHDRNEVYCSPFRDERNPSFSIFDSGRRFHDHASGERGDIIDFSSIAWNCDKKEAVKKLAADVAPLPERKFKARAKPVFDAAAYDSWKKRVTDGFNPHRQHSTLRKLLEKKNIGLNVAASLHREGSLGMHYDSPAYIYRQGIKVRSDVQSSRSSWWLTGSDCNYPWRFNRLSTGVETVILTEGETDAMYAMTSLAGNASRNIRVLAVPRASWRPSREILFAIANDRHTIAAFDNDDAGRELTGWLANQMSDLAKLTVFPWQQFGDSKDLCCIPLPQLTSTLLSLCQ